MTAISTLTTRINRISKELALFASASLVMGVAYSFVDSTLNNFLSEHFALSELQRSFLELPRELPGFLCVFVTAVFWFLSSRRVGAYVQLISLAGILLIGFAAPTYIWLILFLFIYSLGQHIFMPISTTIGMELAREGKTGQRLGQLNAIRNLAAILGSFIVFLGFKYLGFSVQHPYVLAAIGFFIAAVLMFGMQPEKAQLPTGFLQLHREYRLYYIMSVLQGSRKQLFITFAPWVIVTIFHQPTQTIATLLTLGGVIGILFQPLLGWAIDRFGERVVLSAEAIFLAFVCFGYGFARSFFPDSIAFLITCGCYLLDQMLFSVSMARSTYMKKIAKQPGDVQPALTAGVTIDHLFSISIALFAGVIWNSFGYQYVFLLGVGIAVLNFIAATQVKIPASVSN